MSAIKAFLARWRVNRERVRDDAVGLVRDYQRRAHEIARRMAQAERSGQLVSPSLPRGHWRRVQREVRRVESSIRMPVLAEAELC